MQYSAPSSYASTSAASYEPARFDSLASTSSSAQPYYSSQPINGSAAPAGAGVVPSMAMSAGAGVPSQPTASTSTPTVDSLLNEIRTLLAGRISEQQLAQLRMHSVDKLLAMLSQIKSRALSADARAPNAGGPPRPPNGIAANQAQMLSVTKRIQDFATSRSLPFAPTLQLDGRAIQLAALFIFVISREGSEKVSQANAWDSVLAAVGFPPDGEATSLNGPPFYTDAHKQAIKDLHSTYLGPFEQVWLAEVAKKRQAAAPPPAPTSTPEPKEASAVAASPAKVKEPEQPPEPKKRKRQRVEYQPVTRPFDSAGGWSIEAMEATLAQVSSTRRVRATADLGVVDVYSLTMSLRSRIPSEVSFVLNSLKLVAEAIITDPRVHCPLAHSDGLLDELVELLEETAFEAPGDSLPPLSAKRQKAPRAAFDTYGAHARAAAELESELQRQPQKGKAREALGRSETVLALVALFRLFASTGENVGAIVLHPQLISLLLRACALGEQAGSDMAWLPLNDLLHVRKEVMHIIYELGSHLALPSPPAASATLALLRFFIIDQVDSPLLDTSFHTIALVSLARIFVIDINRQHLSRAHARPVELFEYLLRNVPLPDADFTAATTSPESMMSLQMTALALFNLAFVASPGQRTRLREMPGVATTLLRTIKRTMAASARDRSKQNLEEIWTRFLNTLVLLNDDGHGGDADAADSHGAWFGSSRASRAEQVEGEEGAAVDDSIEADIAAAPIFASRGKLEFFQIAAAMSLDPYTHDLLLSLYERKPIVRG